jgi:hypothetical protein
VYTILDIHAIDSMYTHVKCLHKSDSIDNIIPANLQTPQHVFWSGCDKDVDMDEV